MTRENRDLPERDSILERKRGERMMGIMEPKSFHAKLDLSDFHPPTSSTLLVLLCAFASDKRTLGIGSTLLVMFVEVNY
jgi:hypothetical protein